MTESAQKLKPCPFCGQPAATKKSDGWHAAGCTTYMAPGVLCYGQSIALQYRSEAEAIEVWNYRAATETEAPEGWPISKETRGTLPYPADPTDALTEVLSLMLYTTTPIAHAMRAAGADISTKCEAEQAHVLHWLIQLALQHGDAWREKARASMDELRAAMQAAREVQ